MKLLRSNPDLFLLGFGSKGFWDRWAPSIEVTLLRIGHLLNVRGTEFFNFADLRFVDRMAYVSPELI